MTIECPNCASNNFNNIGFGKHICQYCGTVVEIDHGNVYRLEICEKPVKYLESNIVLSAESRDYLMQQGALYSEIREILSKDMGNRISKEMQIKEYFDIHELSYLYKARIGVIL